jgi:hypothetical protein
VSGNEPDAGPTAGSPRSDDRGGRPASGGSQPATAADRIRRLRAENERLRREYDHARRLEYRRTATGLAAVGALAVGAAAVFPSVREVLIVVGSIGLFSAVLTRFLTPERFLPIDVAEGIYEAVDETRGSLVADLDLAGDARYVPTEGGAVRLFVPQREGAPLPDPDDLQSTLVVPADGDRRGVAFSPSGETLFREFGRTLGGSLGETPGVVAPQLAEGLSDGLELVDSASVEVDGGGNRVSMRLDGVPFGPVDRVDHPVVSFAGVGLATGLGTAVSVVDARVDDDGAAVTYAWDAGDRSGVGGGPDASASDEAVDA